MLYASTLRTTLTYQEVRQALAAFRRTDYFKSAVATDQREWSQLALDRLNHLRDGGRDIPTEHDDPWYFSLWAQFAFKANIIPAFEVLKESAAYDILTDVQKAGLEETCAQLTEAP
jgi:hypothetical protein